METWEQFLIRRHAGDVWNHVFDTLDGEIDVSTDDAARIATAVRVAFCDAVNEDGGDTPARP